MRHSAAEADRTRRRNGHRGAA
ncbi:hypothetical protein [Burkholderia territorii]